MKGYEHQEATVEHDPEVVEDKVVIVYDGDGDGGGGWRVTRTTVTRRMVETTERFISKTFPTYPAAAVAAEADHAGKPVYVRGDDRGRAELEAKEAADSAALRAALDAARRQRRAARQAAEEDTGGQEVNGG